MFIITIYQSVADGLTKTLANGIGLTVLGATASSLKAISEEEKQYLPSFSRGFRNVVLWILLTSVILIYGTAMINITMEGKESILTKVVAFIFLNWLSPWITILLIAFLVTTIASQRLKLRIRASLQKYREENKKRAATGLFILSALFAFFVTGYAILLVQMILSGINTDYSLGLHYSREVFFYLNKVDRYEYFVLLFAVFLIYSLLLLLMRAFYRTIYFEKISITVHLKNGMVLYEKYIINHNVDNSILIADSYKRTDRNKMLIPKAGIDYIVFNRVDYSFGEKRIKSKLDYKESEMGREHDDLIEKWRKDQIYKHRNF